MRNRIRGAMLASAAAVAVAAFSLAVIPTAGQAPAIYRAPRSAFKDGKPDLDGIWQANNTANWDIQDHAARQGPVVELGAAFSIPAGLGVVEGNEIPYQPWAAAKKKENAANWMKLDPEITRFLEHPVLELSTNLAENSIRPVALGRKNWIHVGSQQAGPKVAAILSIVETCRRIKVPIRGYLAAVLPGIADISIQRLADLTPAAWAARQ